ncbi:MAG: right-handed parallel beta-helix repeat-containing protein, partial [Planctomycetaceae bacterium]|nr:right-handed parallel beta-helix repeat-containing protein [Planctomycetaceae bacterium]
MQRSRRAHPTRTARKPLSFERLEDRTLLAPFVVTNNNDSGAGSLRQAILSANALAGADTISFQAGLTGTIFLFAGEMDITGNLTITGNGAANTVIDAQTFSRIFDISNVPTAVTFDGLTLQNGQVTDAIGGAIRSQQDAGTVTIRNSILSGNKALGAVFGHGGAVGGTYASFLIEDSTLSGNVTGGDGGALRTVYGSIVIEDSTLSGNVAGDDGGAVYIYSTGDLTLTRCTLTGNTAGGDGGATRTFGAAAVTTVTDCVFSSNYSGNIGGAISATSNSSVVIANSTLSGNHTINSGGAVYVQGDLHVTSSTLSGNYTRISFSTGGAIASPAAGNVTIVNSTISGNQALDGPSGGVGGMRGGGIFFNAGDSTIVNSTITNNSASNGGGISIYANNNGESL